MDWLSNVGKRIVFTVNTRDKQKIEPQTIATTVKSVTHKEGFAYLVVDTMHILEGHYTTEASVLIINLDGGCGIPYHNRKTKNTIEIVWFEGYFQRLLD